MWSESDDYDYRPYSDKLSSRKQERNQRREGQFDRYGESYSADLRKEELDVLINE